MKMYLVRNKLGILILFLVLDLKAPVVAIIKDAIIIRVNGYEDLYFNTNHVADLTNVVSATRCASLCSQNQDCLTFFYNAHLQLCRLHSSAFFNKNEASAALNWTLYAFENKQCPTYYGFYQETSGLCLHISTSIYKFYDARLYCYSLNSRVVSLDSVSKRTELENFKNRPDIASILPHEVVWLGMQKTPSGWQWENGAFLGPERKWGIGQPYCPVNLACDCVAIRKLWGDLWDDCVCTSSLTVICEYP